jgi:hypothetical protein
LCAIAVSLFAHNVELPARLFLGGPFALAFLWAGTWWTHFELRGQRDDPGILLRAWQRAVELAGTISAERLPAPSVAPPLSLPTWPEKRPQRGWCLFRDHCEHLSRRAIEALSEAHGCTEFEVNKSNSAADDELVVAVSPSHATYRERRSGCLVLPQVRMITRFSPTGATLEICVAKPHEGVLVTALFAAAGMWVFVRLFQVPPNGPGELTAAAICLLVGFIPVGALGWRWRQIVREARKLRHAWEQACSGSRGSHAESLA